MGTFGEDIAAWAAEAQNELGFACAEKTRQLFKAVVMNSPEFPTARYSTGKFIANWNVGPNANLSVTEATSNKIAKIADIESTIYDDFFFTHPEAFILNNVDYTDKVEYMGWTITGPYQPVSHAYQQYWAGEAPVARAIADNTE